MKTSVSPELKLTKKQAQKLVPTIPSWGVKLFGKTKDSMGNPYSATPDEVLKEIAMGGTLMFKNELSIVIRCGSDLTYFAGI